MGILDRRLPYFKEYEGNVLASLLLAKKLWLVKSHLVSVGAEVPTLYFPLSDNELQCLIMRQSNAYYNSVMKTDTSML